MRSTPEYNRQKIAITFATSGLTSVDTTLTEPNLVHSILLVGHTWPVVAGGASAASGANVILVDSDGNTLWTSAEVLTGSTTLMSADIMVFPNDVIRYQITCEDAITRCTSGTGTPTSGFPTATVVLYKY